MWILRALLNLHHFWRLYRRAGDYFRDERPDAVVLIDYPGFNWWIARAAKKCGIPVFYYGVPQMWGWARLASAEDAAVWWTTCCANCRSRPIGIASGNVTPRTSGIRTSTKCNGSGWTRRSWTSNRSRPGRLVTILPGSRTQEVVKNLPGFLTTAA